jgi:hypothetical protein
MARKQEQYINVKGMSQDISKSKIGKEFIYSGNNIRLNNIEDNELLSITNEKSPIKKKIENSVILAGATGVKIIGLQVLGDYILVFVTARVNSINTGYLIRLESSLDS